MEMEGEMSCEMQVLQDHLQMLKGNLYMEEREERLKKQYPLANSDMK